MEANEFRKPAEHQAWLVGATPSPCLRTPSVNSRSLPAFGFIWGRGPEGAAWPWSPSRRKREQFTSVTLSSRQGAPGLPAQCRERVCEPRLQVLGTNLGACSGHEFRSKEFSGPPCVFLTTGKPCLFIIGVWGGCKC